MEKLYTVNDLAQELQISTRTIHRFLAEGQIAHYRIGNRIKFSQKHLSEFLSRSEYCVI